MKTLSLTAVSAVACVSAFAQGSFLFNNFGGGANAPVFDFDGTTKLGNTFEADLYWAAGTVTDSSRLTALGQPATFVGSGYFLGGTRQIPGTTDETITAQVRVWNIADGSSWLAASTVPGAHLGESALFSLALVTVPTPPIALANLQSFNLQPPFLIPEPSTLALAGLGLAVQILRRRK
jgi:PEP-CTERM motif-containing protein